MSKMAQKELQRMQDEYNAAVDEMTRQWSHDRFMENCEVCFRAFRCGVITFGGLALLTFLVLLVGCSDPAPAAPAPLPKRETTRGRALELSGTWRVRYGGLSYHYEFRKDGTLSCPPWSGSWNVSGRTLRVTESTKPEDAESWLCWEVELDERLRGTAKVTQGSYGGSSGATLEFRLRPEWMWQAHPHWDD